MPASNPTMQGIAELDRQLVAAVRSIKLLGGLSWPASTQNQFLDQWRRGSIHLPAIEYPVTDFRDTRDALARIERSVDAVHPVGEYLLRTAQSWRIATELLDAAGTAQISELSRQLFGRPGDRVPGTQLTNVDAARHFIELASELIDDAGPIAEPGIPAVQLQAQLQPEIDALFGSGIVKVELDPQLIAKAAAGSRRIRLRSGTWFSQFDHHQLLEHEAFVHSLTALNGRAQPLLASLGLASPRVIATQEGLAVFAELMSGAMDMPRLKRISLRIIAIDMALNGADFIEVFRYFIDAGQSDTDSFASAQRVFRGAPLTGGSAFTKDTVYLHGLLAVHTFFRWALRQRRFDLCRNIFAGKMTLRDAIELEPYFTEGTLTPPRYLPPWAQSTSGLAGRLGFSLFINNIRLDQVDVEQLMMGL
ncbi:MAG: flavohemoglobin expression-modulating QEGLA motif protein [Dokdonella sp.]